MKKFSRNFWQNACKDPVFFAQELLQIEPHPGQKKWLSSSVKPENLLHTGNRWGKSTVQAAKILHRCFFKIRNLKYNHTNKYSAVNASITQDQANIIFNQAVKLIKGRLYLELLVKEIKFTPFPHIVFGNGAVFWSRSTQRRGEYLLGQDYDYFNFDEVAFEPHSEYVVNEVIMMRLADRAGMLDYTSTPKGKNWFYKKYHELKNHPEYGYVQNGDSRENPFISKEYLDRKLKSLSESKIAQNIQGLFVDDLNQVIKEEYISLAVSQAKGLGLPIPGHTYVQGWDLARKRSYTVGIVLDVLEKPYQLVSFERFKNRDWKDVYAIIRKKKKEYPGEIIIDATGLGDPVLSELSDIHPLGFNFGEKGGKIRSELIANLEQAHVLNKIAYPYIEQIEDNEIWSLQDELRNFYWDSKDNCDAVMALGLALWMMRSGVQMPIMLVPKVQGVR